MIKFNDAPFVPCNDCANWESCQEEAYRKGASDMENAKQIIIDSLLSEKEQIRAESIEEFANELTKPSNYERFDFDDCLDSSDKANDFFKYVFSIAEHLKEQHNV